MKIKRRACDATVPNTAMGDIAFNLLIFFVILARVQDDSHLKWNPAQAGEIQKAGHSVVSIVIDVDQRLYLNGQEIGVASLADRIESALEGKPAGERTVLMKVHREATALRFEPVIEAVGQAGGELVHVVEERRD